MYHVVVDAGQEPHGPERPQLYRYWGRRISSRPRYAMAIVPASVVKL